MIRISWILLLILPFVNEKSFFACLFSFLYELRCILLFVLLFFIFLFFLFFVSFLWWSLMFSLFHCLVYCHLLNVLLTYYFLIVTRQNVDIKSWVVLVRNWHNFIFYIFFHNEYKGKHIFSFKNRGKQYKQSALYILPMIVWKHLL